MSDPLFHIVLVVCSIGFTVLLFVLHHVTGKHSTREQFWKWLIILGEGGLAACRERERTRTATRKRLEEKPVEIRKVLGN